MPRAADRQKKPLLFKFYIAHLQHHKESYVTSGELVRLKGILKGMKDSQSSAEAMYSRHERTAARISLTCSSERLCACCTCSSQQKLHGGVVAE